MRPICGSCGEHRGVSPTCDDKAAHWDSRRHFFAAAAEAMRRILVEHARRKGRVRHGGGRDSTELDEQDIAAVQNDPNELLAVDEALDRLADDRSQAAELVKLRYLRRTDASTRLPTPAGHLAAHGGPLLGLRPRLAARGNRAERRSLTTSPDLPTKSVFAMSMRTSFANVALKSVAQRALGRSRSLWTNEIHFH